MERWAGWEMDIARLKYKWRPDFRQLAGKTGRRKPATKKMLQDRPPPP